MSNWYTSREGVKRALKINGSDRDSVIDAAIEAASREIDNLTSRRFIPKTETRSFTWPYKDTLHSYVLPLDEDLLATTALTKEGDDLVVIVAADYFLEPSNLGPPYSRIEIDRSSTAFFASKDTSQRAIRVTGRWGYSEDTKAAGTLAEALDATEVDVDITDASKVDVGDTILIDSEQMFVSGRALLTTTATLNGNLTADKAQVTVTVNTGSLVKQGEIIQLDSEKMLVESISGNNLTVQRAYDGSVLAAHTGAVVVNAFRTLTAERGANGTTAATHSTATAISKYVPPADISGLCRALAIASYEQDQSGWTGMGGGLSSESATTETKMIALDKKRSQIKRAYRRRVVVAV